MRLSLCRSCLFVVHVSIHSVVSSVKLPTISEGSLYTGGTVTGPLMQYVYQLGRRL